MEAIPINNGSYIGNREKIQQAYDKYDFIKKLKYEQMEQLEKTWEVRGSKDALFWITEAVIVPNLVHILWFKSWEIAAVLAIPFIGLLIFLGFKYRSGNPLRKELNKLTELEEKMCKEDRVLAHLTNANYYFFYENEKSWVITFLTIEKLMKTDKEFFLYELKEPLTSKPEELSAFSMEPNSLIVTDGKGFQVMYDEENDTVAYLVFPINEGNDEIEPEKMEIHQIPIMNLIYSEK